MRVGSCCEDGGIRRRGGAEAEGDPRSGRVRVVEEREAEGRCLGIIQLAIEGGLQASHIGNGVGTPSGSGGGNQSPR